MCKNLLLLVLYFYYIGIFTWVLLRMVDVFGGTFGIPGHIMGITFVTFGTSVPDLLCSVVVIRRGRADMAMSQVGLSK